MANKALATGGALIALGVVVSILSSSNSVTSLIPAFIGVAFLVIGFGARARPDAARHFLHAGAALALLAILGSVGSLVGRGSTGWALFSQVATIVVTGAFLYLAIESFRSARAARLAESA